MKEVKILYVEDDLTLSFLTKDNLEMNGFRVFHFENGQDALDMFDKVQFHICLLDVMVPKFDGFSLAKEIRKRNKDIPIIFLTAKSLQEDKITGLKLGGDDYIVKPYGIEELLLKIDIFLRRSKVMFSSITESLVLGETRLDCLNHKLYINNSEVGLTSKETELLAFFYKNPNVLLKREEILKNIWGEDSYFLGRSLDVFISRIRKILKNANGIKLINAHGVGFKMVI